MEKMGITIHLGKSTTAVLGEESVTGLAFKDGSTLDCDMAVVSAGIQPNAEIGVRAGLTVERAIAVDNQMRSVDDHAIYVVGECAQHRGKVSSIAARSMALSRRCGNRRKSSRTISPGLM
jgi:nitrite reductase (NADH) large subunit